MMKTRSGFLLAVMAILLGTPGTVCFAGDGPVFSWSGSVDVRNQHIGGMNGARIIPAPALQPSVTVSRENCYANVWASLHLGDTLHFRSGDEIDFSLGCTVSWGSVRHSLSLAYYDLHPVGSLRGDLFGMKDIVTFPTIAGFTPSLSLEVDIPENKSVLPGGVVYKAEFARDVPIGGVSSVVTFAFGGHGHAYGVSPEAVSFVRLGIAWPLRVGSTLVTPSLMLQHGMGGGGMAGNEILFNLGTSW
ncbi:MAG: hypothetical protein IPJ68_05280 [Candidatus Moraniibacteriota bacterium]|nr:MAG: hypothetical protein IPJ68_05280 [Candidatus Moranbacteria bacterium]